MTTLIEELENLTTKKRIIFAESFYQSADGKTVMGEVPFKEILFLDYRDTEAGSNPREYAGLKKSNGIIIKSVLKDSANMFRFLHSGIIVCLTAPVINDNGKSIAYEECCLTNGNQTRFIILILTLIKLFCQVKSISQLTQKEYNAFIKETFDKFHVSNSILKYVKFNKVLEVADFLNKEGKYMQCFDDMGLETFLSSRIRVQVNLINGIISDLDDKLDEYSAGTLIAEANNDTQNVKPDDIFGNKYKRELEDLLFGPFIKEYGNKVKIEYRYGEIAEKTEKAHILTLLRPIIATGILTKDKDIFKLTNQRLPIYNIFSKLISKNDKATKTIEIISKITPLLYKIRKDHIMPILEDRKRELIRDYKKKAYEEELNDTVIKDEIYQARGNDEKIEKIIRGAVNYNIEHIIPVLVYRMRKLFKETNGSIQLTIPQAQIEQFLKTLVEAIYDSYVKMKLKGLPTSLTTRVRSSDFYDYGVETYNTLIKLQHIEETSLIEENKFLIS
jgi:hypothetical protein